MNKEKVESEIRWINNEVRQYNRSTTHHDNICDAVQIEHALLKQGYTLVKTGTEMYEGRFKAYVHVQSSRKED